MVCVLAGKGVMVILPVRDRAKAGPVLASIAGHVEALDIDLAHLPSVRDLCEELSKALPRENSPYACSQTRSPLSDKFTNPGLSRPTEPKECEFASASD